MAIVRKGSPSSDLDVVLDDVLLAVVAAVEEAAGAAFFAAEGVIALEGEERARADAAGADEGAVAPGGGVGIEGLGHSLF